MSFTLYSSTTETNTTNDVLVFDGNNDGYLDWFAGSVDTPGSLLHDIYGNNGDSTFSHSTFGNSGYFMKFAGGDVDLDGDLDIVAVRTGSIGNDRIIVYKNNGSNVYTLSASLFPTSAGDFTSIELADIDNDGDLDIIVGTLANNTKAIRINDGHGNFSEGASTLPTASDIAIADFNSDGYVDVALTQESAGKIRVYVNSGTGAFIESTNNTVANAKRLSAGDLNADGLIDLVLYNSTSTYVAPYIQQTNGTFSAGTSLTTAVAVSLGVLGDVNNDGSLDILAATSGGNYLWTNDGSANFGSSTVTSAADITNSIAMGDFDNDGDLDYVSGTTTAVPNRFFKNDQAATSPNTAPTAPTTGFGVTLFSQKNRVATLDSTDSIGTHVSIAVGTDDIPAMSYYDFTNGDLKVTKCGNTSCSSGNTTATLDSTGDVGLYTSIKVGSDGYPIISYYDNTNDDLKVVKCGNPTCSTGNATTIVDSTGNVGKNTSMAIGGDGFAVISYYDETNGDLKVTKCGNAACSSANITTTVESTGNVGELSSIAIGADGYPVISHFMTLSNDLKVTKCGNAACTSGNITSTIVASTDIANKTSIAVGTDGYPVIVYIPDSTGELIVVKCNNASCSTTLSSTVVDTSVFGVGAIPSITIGADSYPVISYGKGTLKVIRCGNIGCTSGNTTTVVDTVVNNPNYTSIALGANDNPIIAYNDDTDKNMKFAMCGNASCSAGGTDGSTTYRLAWGSGSDTQTATKLLQYQVRVGTGSSAHNIVSGKTVSPNWVSRVMPNGQSRTYLLKNLECRTGLTYYWSVAAVDSGFMSTASSEQAFTLDDACTISSGGGSPPPPPPPSVGGGLSAKYFRTSKPETGSAPGTGILSVTAFSDIDGNDQKSARELSGFKGLPMTASGRTADNVVVRRTLTLNDAGTIAFDLPVSDDRGYWIVVDTGSSVLDGYQATGNTASGGYVFRSGGKSSVAFGFRRSNLLSYKPCLVVGSASKDERSGTDAQIFMQRLEDSFGNKIFRGLNLADELVSRKEFFTLLSRSHCVEQMRDHTALLTKLKTAAESLKINLPLIDLRIDVQNADSLLAYSLLAAEADISRSTLIGEAADFASPMTRGEAIRSVVSVLPIPVSAHIADQRVIPKDLDPSDPLVSDFLTLQNLGILPESFQPILGQSQGMTAEETSLMLSRAALRAGRVSLVPEVVNVKGLKKAPPVPTFLSVLPPLKPRSCIVKDSDRPSAVSFSDVLPGDPLFEGLRDLLSRSTKNSAKQTLWLLSGARRPTEFGIVRGQTKISASEPVSIVETIRDLLVLACLPPDTAIDVMSGKDKVGSRQGSGESRVARDRISGLPRDASFASRVLYRAQDHQKEFDLSLFTYAPEMLRNEERSPGSGLSVIEASRLLASGLLMIHVKEKSLSPLQAENAMEELAAAIRKDLTGKDVDWRDESSLKTVPFTKGMLLQFLVTVVSGKMSHSSIPTPSTLSLGEIWWERIK